MLAIAFAFGRSSIFLPAALLVCGRQVASGTRGLLSNDNEKPPGQTVFCFVIPALFHRHSGEGRNPVETKHLTRSVNKAQSMLNKPAGYRLPPV
jgi:hypothetical protein